MIDDPLSLLTAILWLAALAPWPVAFLFGACSACCEQCPWMLNYERCLYWENNATSTFDGQSGVVTGDTQRISVRLLGDDYLGPGQGDIQIFRVQSEIQVPIRVSISASEASRTPVGTTRSQVWRFTRAAPTIPVAAVYDVLGPAWHLEVELSVTGVETEEGASVTTSIGTDSEGQPKLFVVVNQWTATITHDETVTLFPTGLQRWGPGLSGTQTFRLTNSTAAATRVAGDNISGWTVSKLSGITINERAYAVRYLGTGGGVFLHEPNVLAFLNGDGTLAGPSRQLSILPNSVLCGVINSGLAINMDLLPSSLTLTYSQNVRDNDPFLCEEQVALYGGCGLSLWSYRWDHIRSVTVGIPTELPVAPRFYGGATILWMMINGPFRQSAPVGNTGTLTWGASPGKYNGRDRPLLLTAEDYTLTCPEGMIRCHRSICVPASIEITNDNIGVTLSANISCRGLEPGKFGNPNNLDIAYSVGEIITLPTDSPCYNAEFASAAVFGSILDWCDDSGHTSPLEGTMVFTLKPIIASDLSLPEGCEETGFNVIVPLPGEQWDAKCPEPISHLRCHTFSAPAANWVISSFTVVPPPSPSDGPGEGPCVLHSVRIDGISSSGNELLLTSNLSLAAAQAGDCYYARLGFRTPTSCGTIDHSECDSCTPSVSVVSGAEYARVTYLESGDRAGLIEIVALTTWLVGQGVTFTVTCGEDSITHTIERG